MRHLLILAILSSCNSMPEFFKSVEDIATDDAIEIKVDRDAIKKDTDVYIDLRVINKDNSEISP